VILYTNNKEITIVASEQEMLSLLIGGIIRGGNAYEVILGGVVKVRNSKGGFR
jgi:hypothetical protein